MSAPTEDEIERARTEAADEYARTFLGRAAKVGDVARQLTFAGIAIVWLFKVGGTPGIAMPRLLDIALILFTTCLLLDLLQGIALAIQSNLWHQMWTRNVLPGRYIALARFYLQRRPFRKMLVVELALLALAYVLVIVFLASVTRFV